MKVNSTLSIFAVVILLILLTLSGHRIYKQHQIISAQEYQITQLNQSFEYEIKRVLALNENLTNSLDSIGNRSLILESIIAEQTQTSIQQQNIIRSLETELTQVNLLLAAATVNADSGAIDTPYAPAVALREIQPLELTSVADTLTHEVVYDLEPDEPMMKVDTIEYLVDHDTTIKATTVINSHLREITWNGPKHQGRMVYDSDEDKILIIKIVPKQLWLEEYSRYIRTENNTLNPSHDSQQGSKHVSEKGLKQRIQVGPVLAVGYNISQSMDSGSFGNSYSGLGLTVGVGIYWSRQ